MKESAAKSVESLPSQETGRDLQLGRRMRMLNVSTTGLFLLASAYTIYLVRPVLLPLIYALLLTLVLKPVHRKLERYFRLPGPLAALLVILAVSVGIGAAFARLSTPIVKYAEELRVESVKEKVKKAFQPISDIQKDIADVAEEVEKMTEPEESGAEPGEDEKGKPDGEGPLEEEFKVAPPDPAPVVEEEVKEPKPEKPPAVEVKIRKDPVGKVYDFLANTGSHIAVTLALVFFFLAFGDTMVRRLAEVDAAADVIDDLTRDVSYYLFTITLVNAGLGVAIGVAMWLLGMPNPVLWGVMAALLNYIPYIGAVMGTCIVAVVAVITFEHSGQIVPVPLTYLALTLMEGNFVTPWIIGKRFTLNPIIVFLWVVCWGAMWGIPGMLIGLPLLMVFRILCSKLPALSRVERVISI